ncbi:hypothetical protein [Phenylobacterium sp.]|uniref:hypothetical protein n=1 Tax=Phenylobacterium sp. TaxID=1871053 RepID=UPI0035618CC6
MEVLNTREIATVIWFAILLIWAVWKGNAWPALRGVARSFFKPILLRSIVAMAIYVAGSVWLLERLDLWRLANLKTTLVWFGTFVLGWMFDLKRWESDPDDTVKTTLRKLLSFTVIVTFVTEFYTFPLVAELVLVPVVVFISLMAGVAESKSETALVTRPFRGLLSLLGGVLLFYAAWRLVSDFKGFATASTGREFAVPALLSLLFLPFMYAFNVYSAYMMVAIILPIRLKASGVAGYAMRKAVLSFGLNVKLLRRWKAALFNLGAESREDVRRIVAMMQAAHLRERHPPPIPPEIGWPPQAAATWLSDKGLPTQGYNPQFAEWRANSAYRKLSQDVLGDSLTYTVSGAELAATQLTLTLNLDCQRSSPTPQASLDAFADATLSLIVSAFGEKAIPALRGLKNRHRRTRQGLATAQLKETEDRLRLTITHRAHVEPKF